MEDSSKKVTRSTTPPSRDTSRSTTSPTSRSASEAPSLRGRRVSCGPHSSDSSVVLGILQNIAQQTVEQAIVQHQQRGGKAVSGARVRITPGGSVRIGQEEKGEAAIPQVVQEFTVVPSQDENGNEVTAVTPAAQLVDPNFSAAYETSPSISTFPPMNDIYGLNTIGGRATVWNQPLGGAFRLPPHMTAAHTPFSTPTARPMPRPRSTCCLTGRTCRSSSSLQRRSSASGSTGGCCRRPTCGSAWAQPSYASWSCGRLPSVSPSCCEDHVPATPTPHNIDTSAFADQLMQSFSGSAKSRNLPGNLKELIKDILKLWATKACYQVRVLRPKLNSVTRGRVPSSGPPLSSNFKLGELGDKPNVSACFQDAARAVKAWMTRHRCSYSEGATEELAVREVPQQYEKYRNLGRATEKLQRQLEAKLSSTILQPVHQVPTTERERVMPSHEERSTTKGRKLDLTSFRLLANHVARLNALFTQIQLLSRTSQQEVSDAKEQASAIQAAQPSEDGRMLQLKLHQFDAALKAITKTCNKLAAAHKDDAARTSRGEAACDAVERARSQELYEERDHLLARVAAQQEMLRQLSEVNQRQIAELVKLKGRHRALCKITPGVESLRLSSASADVSRVFVKPQGISTLLVKTQPAVRQHATSRGYAPHNKTRVFEFDHVYDEKRTTYDIYEDLKELTASVLAGNILGFVVLGPPKSGKTSTLFFSPQSSATEGIPRDPPEEGLVVHCLRHLFDLLEGKCLLAPREGSTDVTLRCTCVEVYNEVLLDAFDVHSRVDRTKPDVVKNARTGSVRITNLRVIGGNITGESTEELACQNRLLNSIMEELRAALERRHEASRNSHVVFTVSVEIIDRDVGEHHEGKLVFSMMASSADPTLKPPFDLSTTAGQMPPPSHNQDSATTATHLTNRGVSSLSNILKARKSAKGGALCGEVFKESKLTRILEECFHPPASSVLLLTVRNDSLRLNLAQFYADVCALARR